MFECLGPKINSALLFQIWKEKLLSEEFVKILQKWFIFLNKKLLFNFQWTQPDKPSHFAYEICYQASYFMM